MSIAGEKYNKENCEYLRIQAKQKFDRIRGTWVECGKWALPWRIKWLLSQTPGERNNYHIVDPTHVVALRSYVAGFLEGNTSASRPWYRTGTSDPEVNNKPDNHAWLDKFTRRTLQVLGSSNFYYEAGQFYYDYGCMNTGAHYVDEIDTGLFFHTLTPGSFYVINDGHGRAVVLVREFSLNVKAVVDTYAKKREDGTRPWSNISSSVRKMFEDGIYTEMVDIVHVIKHNEYFDPEKSQMGDNKEWVSLTYEVGGNHKYIEGTETSMASESFRVGDKKKYLNVNYSRRKPFVVGKSHSNMHFEYGETGPTLDALGLVKSLNKKAIGKDQALEMMLQPPMQGPANLRKSYITGAPRGYVPLDATSLNVKGGMRPVYEVNPAIVHLNADVEDLRRQVNKIYYADFLLFLSQNPKTRTAAETNAILAEQQLVIGPNLQSLNWTYNMPILDLVMDYVLYDDPWIMENPLPEDLEGKFLRPEFVSTFAQAQHAADLPAIERYVAMITTVGNINPMIFDKANVDKLADLYEDRLFLPAGLNNPQAKVDAMREAALASKQQQQMMNETVPALAGAAKDAGLKLA